ncbi:MAG: pro-sigmaK processing inhibitor BofA family protein [Halobacteriales archaeon]|nr:pro-sigmaK processing inhibitor BofA family protein [Halobacteriales archaeon]
MATGIEIGLLVLVALVLVGVYLAMKVIKPLIYNAIIGLVLLAVINFLDIPILPEVEIGVLAIAVIALGGIPGVILVLLLAFLDVAFTPGVVVAPLVVA